MDIIAQLGAHVSELISASLGLLGGFALGYTYKAIKTVRASTGGTAADNSKANVGRDLTFGDNVHGDKIGGNKFNARDITVNR